MSGRISFLLLLQLWYLQCWPETEWNMELFFLSFLFLLKCVACILGACCAGPKAECNMERVLFPFLHVLQLWYLLHWSHERNVELLLFFLMHVAAVIPAMLAPVLTGTFQNLCILFSSMLQSWYLPCWPWMWLEHGISFCFHSCCSLDAHHFSLNLTELTGITLSLFSHLLYPWYLTS